MHPRSFLTVFFYVSLAFALESWTWSLRSLLRLGPSKRLELRRLATRSIPTGWTSVGCVTDGGARALSYKYTSSSLTQESCISTCDTKGYIYAGLQYADECWCGNTLANGLGVAVTASQCNMACKGDSSEICGASYRITLFNKTVQTTTTTTTTATTTAAQTTSTAVATSGWALTQACAVDTSARILQGYHTSSSSNTQSWCQSICLGKDFTIAGVENGNECWCGNAVVGTPADGSASTCSYACAGDSSSKCGGNWRMQIYTYTAPASTATTTTSTTSTSTATTTTSAATATSTASSVWSLSQACAVDTSARILQGYHTSSSSNTQSWCQSTCLAKGFSIAGVENGNECWCGNAIIGTPADGSASTCSYACAGDSSSKCGGNWRMQIYTYTSPATTATTSGTSSTTTATTTTSAATSTASPGWALSSACVVDTSARILQGYNVASSSNTPAWCHSTCLAKGFIIAGVENGNECWCGNAIVGGTPTADSGSGCSYVCAGDSLSKCGGNWRMQVYTYMAPAMSTSASTSTSATSTTSTTSSAAATLATGWALSRPCVVDTSARVLQGYSYTSAALTPAACQLACGAKGLSIAGVENGSVCYCGNVFVGGAPANATASDCSVACAGDASLTCGGSDRLTVYTSTVASIGDFWQTTWDRTKQLTALNLTPINFTTVGPIADADITVDETAKYQSMDGFGASLTDSSATLFAALKTTNTNNYYTLLHQLFDVSDGAYSAMSSVLRLPLGASDFSDTVWSYCDTAGDTSFSTFDINRTPSAVWTVLYDILAINPLIKIYVVPWSPPAWMKDSNNMRGGSISSNYVGIYPTYLFKALQGLQGKGIPLYAIAIQNEPQYSDTSYPSTTVPAATEATIALALRTLMNNNGFSGVKIIGYDHNFNNAATYPVQLMQQAGDAFAGASFHCYGGTVSQIDNFRSAYPAKEVHLTECSGVYGSDWWSDIKWYSDNLFIGGPEHYGRTSMMWNLALDGNGQPKLSGSKSCGTPCRGVVQINSDGTYSFNQEFWPIAHAGKAIAPRDAGGAFGQRIAVSVGGTYYWSLRVSAYATARLSSTDETRYSLVVLNWRDYASSAWNPTPQTTTINFRGVQATYTFPVGLTTLSWYA